MDAPVMWGAASAAVVGVMTFRSGRRLMAVGQVWLQLKPKP
jgi:hypothetical protein